jgi:predicted nucleic acid-binding Zn ribbon protein
LIQLDDLPGDGCAFCGADLEHKRVYAIYCTRECKDRHRRHLEQEAAREAKAGNTCISCGEMIPTDRRADTLFCSKSCYDKVSYARCKGQQRGETRKGRACATCGGPVPETLRAGTKYCGGECRDKADRQRKRNRRWMAKR